MHKFDVSKKDKLESPERKSLLPPNRIRDFLELKTGDYLADIGCGTGYLTFPFAEVVGENGLVYALDIEPEMLKTVEDRAFGIGAENIRFALTGEYDLEIPNHSVTKALMCTVLHEIRDKEVFLAEVSRILNPDGLLVIVEWKKDDTEQGPSRDHRIDEEECNELLQECGFTQIETEELNDTLYMIKGRFIKERA